MNGTISKLSNNPVVAAVVAAVLTAVVTVPSTYYFARLSVADNARTQVALQFAIRNDDFPVLLTSYVSALAKSSDTSEIVTKLRAAVAAEQRKTEEMRAAFGVKYQPLLDEYSTALDKFSKELALNPTKTTSRGWVEAFGHVLDVRDMINRSLLKGTGAVS